MKYLFRDFAHFSMELSFSSRFKQAFYIERLLIPWLVIRVVDSFSQSAPGLFIPWMKESSCNVARVFYISFMVFPTHSLPTQLSAQSFSPWILLAVPHCDLPFVPLLCHRTPGLHLSLPFFHFPIKQARPNSDATPSRKPSEIAPAEWKNSFPPTLLSALVPRVLFTGCSQCPQFLHDPTGPSMVTLSGRHVNHELGRL